MGASFSLCANCTNLLRRAANYRPGAFCECCTNFNTFRAKSLCSLTKNFFPKPLDKRAPLWYNIDTEGERAPLNTYLRGTPMKRLNRYWDNDFDRAFDEAIDALEREAEEKEENA